NCIKTVEVGCILKKRIDHILKEYFDNVGITHETSVVKTPQQNGVVKRRNHTLVEAARTMLIFSYAPLFLWAEAIATACYTQNPSASPICLMARATPTKSWLWHQRLSHLNFDTINDLAKNDLVSCLPKFKYAKEYLCPSCEQGKSKRASHPPNPIPNSKQRLHLLHIDLCGPMRVASFNGKWYVLVIVDDYSRYTWVHFLITKDETP
nr:retrovirus-related Pol polyprotein from transposon TNT 1-94 [Tanacetum cinerariifolium]